MFDFWTMAKEVAAEQKAENEAMRRKAEGRLTLRESYDSLQNSFDKLYDNTKKRIHVLSKSRGFHIMLKFKDRAESNQKDAVMMYILSNDNVRPLQGMPYSLSTLKKVNQAVENAIYKGLRPLDKRDMGKPLTTDDPDVIIDERSFDNNPDHAIYSLTRDTFYSTDDYATVVERAQSAMAQFEQEGRERGLIVD